MMRKECDNLIDYFNGQLSEEEKVEFENHLETCADCKEELEELEILTDDLPFASEPVTPPEDMKDRVLGEVFSQESPAAGENDNDASIKNHQKPSQVNNLDEKKIESGKNRPWLLRGLAAALVLSLAGNLFALVDDQEQTTPEPEEPNPSGFETGTDQVRARVQLQSEGTEASATAALIQQEKGDILTLQAEQLGQLQGEEVYQVWLIEGEKPYRAGTFVANQSGEGAVSYSLSNLPEGTNWDAVAISKEPNATSKTPQGEVILSSEL
ncbi:anti-sigma factor [Halobacillus sp. K22]|uniref:anti-sigma factor n=1 Tax=Halobacillus sp. K22 TaxID=3457431 RepID=UPI003FCDA1ED